MDEEVMMCNNATLDSHDHDESVLLNNSVIQKNKNPNVDSLEELDAYSDDVNNQLTVSRFNSVTKEMLNSLETEAAEKKAQKDIEISRLQETLLSYHVSSEENQTLLSHSVEECKDKYEQSLLLEKTKEIAGLRRELELISKLLTDNGNGDIEALEDFKKARSIVSASSALDTDGNKQIGSLTLTPEKLDELRQFSHEQLINYFKTEMDRLKREHDYTIQEMTEEYFSIKRRCLNLEQRGLLLSLKKNKDFDVLLKKIPCITSKLDKVLENEESVSEGKNGVDVKNRLDSLILENCELRDSLSEAGEEMSRLSQVEVNHLTLIQKLESDAEDSHVQASFYEDIYGSFVREFVKQIQCATGETDLEHQIVRETYGLMSSDLVNREASERNSDLEDSFFESHMTEECCAVIYKEALKEADKKLEELNINVFLKERAWGSEMVEKERFKEEIRWLECLVKEKDNLIKIVENDLATERENLEIQINNLKFQIEKQAVVIQDKNKELGVVSARALEKSKGYEMEISELRQKLELERKNMKITENEKVKSELELLSTEAEKKRLKNQFVAMVLSHAKWSKGFDNLECLVAEKTKKTNSRLKSMESQLSYLLDEVDELKARESMYKQQMEKKTCDVQKAETEVDLLGDEIKSLLGLLEKIYIALDHYSPILKHYPGIMEILKLVRRELRGESKRLSVF